MANAVGICNTNYLDTASMAHSSQRTRYPASNVLDMQQRGLVWRTDGNWRIVAGSNTLVFREAVGVDLTATIAAGTYTTVALCNAIKAALEAAGDSTYTVTFVNSTTFKIEAALGGSATIFQLRMEHANSAAIADFLGYDTVAYTGSLEYSSEETRIHSEEWLQFDLGIATNPKAFCLVNDRNNPMRISPTATLKLQANFTNNWTSPAFEMDIPYSDKALSVWNFDGLADDPAGYRYWRFLIIDRTNPRGYLEFGVAFLGDMITMSRGCAVFPLQRRGISRSVIVEAESGQVFGLKKPKTMGIQLQWQGLTVTEQEEMWDHWENVDITDNWFLIMDAQGAISTTKENEVKLVRFAQEYSDQLRNPRNFESSTNLVEAI